MAFMERLRKIAEGAPESVGQMERGAQQNASAALGIRVARSLHGRWRRLTRAERDRLEPLADDVKERALDLRGVNDLGSAACELRAADERLAGAMIESAEANPEVSEPEVRKLRDDLSRELGRIAGVDV